MNNDLLDCPFCGESDFFITKKKSDDGTITWYILRHRATNRCSITMLDSNNEELIERWNRREVHQSIYLHDKGNPNERH